MRIDVLPKKPRLIGFAATKKRPLFPKAVCVLNFTTPSLFECADVSDQSFDLVVVQNFAKGFHLGLVAVFPAFFDAFEHFCVFHFRLHLGVGVILYPDFLAHFGVAFAIRPVAFGAVLFPVFLHVSSFGRGQRGDAECNNQSDEVFHRCVFLRFSQLMCLMVEEAKYSPGQKRYWMEVVTTLASKSLLPPEVWSWLVK